MSDGRVLVAADAVCEAIRRHAATCERESGNVAAVIRDGEALCEAVLEYEKVLGATSGWSNPLRHLGPLPLFDDGRAGAAQVDSNGATPQGGGASPPARIEVRTRYTLHTDDEAALIAFVSGRFGREVSDTREAIDLLFKSESWDPDRYPPGLMDVDEVAVDISVVPTR